jgi:adenylyltransferase/sulfurtransferase
MDDNRLLRYGRQILLPEIDVAGQQKLLDSRVLVIGLGGLGSPVAMYLAAAGAGRLTLVDDDRVELSNLQRQILHTAERIGWEKARSAGATLAALNPDCRVRVVAERLAGARVDDLVAAHDLVMDCSDNFATRFAINAACHRHAVPLVSGAAIRWEGQVCVFPQTPGSACYRCLYSEQGETDERCSETGVVAPLVGIIGSVQATEAIKLLVGCGATLRNRLLVLDAYRMQWREVRLRPDPACPVCGST